jgi:hypothetical protein
MTRLKMFAMIGLAASGIGVGGLAAAPSASAKPISCETAIVLARRFMALGDIALYVFHDSVQASYYYGKGSGVLAGAC